MKENYRSSGFNDAPGYRSIRSIANLTGKSHFDIEFFDTKRFSCQPTWTTNLSVSMKGEIPLQLLPGKNNKQPLMSGLIPMMIHFAPREQPGGIPRIPLSCEQRSLTTTEKYGRGLLDHQSMAVSRLPTCSEARVCRVKHWGELVKMLHWVPWVMNTRG